MNLSINDRIKGSLMGVAIGDALGFSTEFLSKEDAIKLYPDGLNSYNEILTDSFRTEEQIGKWTDDTNMMIAILDSLIAKKTIDLHDIANNFIVWKNSQPFDIGNLTRTVLMHSNYLNNPIETAKKVWEEEGKQSAGNGGIMRTTISALWNYTNWNEIKQNTENLCKLTHYDPRCVGSCVIIAYLIHNILLNQPFTKSDIIKLGAEYHSDIEKYIELGCQPNLSTLQLDDGATMGYTLKTMAVGLWFYNFAPNYFEGIQSIILEGGDADTNCAVAGGILGAKFGYESIPLHLTEDLKDSEMLLAKIDKLLEVINIKE